MKKIITLILFTMFSLNILAQNINAGLQAWYPLNMNALDASGNNLNGIVNGATLTSDRFGNANSAYLFDGVNNTIALPFDFDYPNRTISMWINVSSFPSLPNYGTLYDSDHNGLQYGKTAFTVYTEGGQKKISYNYGNTLAKVNAALNTWYLITTTVSDSARSYICDNLILTRPLDLIHSSSGNATVSLGCNRLGDANFNGKIDDVRIYNRALTKAEIEFLCTTAIGIKTISRQENKITTMPQPANEKVTFLAQTQALSQTIIALYTVNGSQVNELSFESNQNLQMDVSSLPNGLYFYSLKSDDKLSFGKLMVNH
jgi:hypothetical protein